MHKKACIIVGAGDFNESEISSEDGDYIIAADGGFKHLNELGITPDMILGDFDSLVDIPIHNNIKRYKAEKDETDTALAIAHGIELGYKLFYIYGGTGGRLEHTIANIQCLAWLSKNNMRGYLVSQEQIITSITNDKLLFDSSFCGYISAFAHGGDACGVYEVGLKYPLNNAIIHDDVPIGVSNSFLGVPSSVCVENGTLIVMWKRNQKVRG